MRGNIGSKPVRRRGHSRVIAAVETLETRVLLSGNPANFSSTDFSADGPMVNGHRLYPNTTFEIANASSTLSPPFTPSEIRTAYGLNNVDFGSIVGNGAGQTIALIDAYNDPDIKSDANSFSTTYGLPQFTVNGDGPTLTVENQYGSTSDLPANSTAGGWDVEESLDVEWAHTVAPEANIILFEGNSYSTDSQFIKNESIAVDTAKNMPGVSVVSMSFGIPIYSGETAYDDTFVSPASHGVTFFASSGDSGTPNGYPADSPNVVAVGGTSLTINGDGSYDTETGWYGSGGGISPYESQPIDQSAQAGKFSLTQRTVPDVAWLADPNTGVAVLDTFLTATAFQVGGTSLASPMWAGMTSIVDQGRNLIGLNTLDGPTQTLPLLYSLPSSDFHDEISGNNGFAAGPGYDLVTGLGSPNVPSIVNDMASATFVYVDSSAPATGQTGLSWSNAYTSLQAALATPPSERQIVLVSQGTYTPGSSESSTFELNDNQEIFGSYAGYGASDPDSSGSKFTSTLSGNLGNSQNSFSVVTADGVDSTATLQGFTISGGGGGTDGGGLYDIDAVPTLAVCNFSNDSSGLGGAIYNMDSSPTLVLATFTNDTATDGGAIFDTADSSPSLSNSVFNSCSAIQGGAIDAAGGESVVNCAFTADTAGGDGGAIYAETGCTANLSQCTFTSDVAAGGGALYDSDASPSVANCTFLSDSATSGAGGGIEDATDSAPFVSGCNFDNDTAASAGGGIASVSSQGTVVNCTFVGDSAPLGGAVSDQTVSAPTITNCTFTANTSGSDGGALYNALSSSPAVTNCIFWLDAAPVGQEIFNDSTSAPPVTYSDVDGGYAGTGNINADPLFVSNANPASGNYGNLVLQQQSPCINVGNNSAIPSGITTDIAGHPRIVGGIVDLGAYEATYVYVDPAATGANNGSSWANAYVSLQTPLNIGFYGEQIDVSGGTFKPTNGSLRTASFVIDDGVSIYGGFEALAGSSPLTRNTTLYPTILTGDIGSKGSYNVVKFAEGDDDTTTLDGVTVTGGDGDTTGSTAGAGIYAAYSSANINNCNITGNVDNGGTTYSALGAGLFVVDGDVIITNTTISNNSVEGSDGFGGGLFIEAGVAVISNCPITGNKATVGAAGMLSDDAIVTMTNCQVNTNSIAVGSEELGFGAGIDSIADDLFMTDCTISGDSMSVGSGGIGYGGGIYNGGADVVLTNCLISFDSATDGAGLINNGSDVDLNDCTFSKNSATTGGALYDEGSSVVKGVNSILYGDTASSGAEDHNNSSTLSLTYTDVSGGFGGTGNINSNPLFMATNNFQLEANSPCINVGSNAGVPVGITTDLAGNPRIYDSTVDMGAYESQSVTVTFTGGGDGTSWNNAGNWSTKHVPNQLEDVLIGSGKNINISGGTFSVRSITSSSPIAITSSDLTVLGAVTMTSGALTINAGSALQLGNGGSVGSASGSIVDNGTMLIDRSDALGTVAANISGSGAVSFIGSGTVTLVGTNTFSGRTTVSSGTLQADSPGALSASSDLVDNAAVVVISGSANAPVTVANLTGSGALVLGNSAKSGEMRLAAGGGSSQIGSLSIVLGSTLDITNDTVFVNYGSAPSPATTIQSYLAQGYFGGLWLGSGITSSTVANDDSTQGTTAYSIGYADGADGVVGGLSSGVVEIMPTLAGDARLAGTVNFGDFQILAQYFGKSGSWDEGNYTYASTVVFAAFQELALNFGQTSAGLAGAAAASVPTGVFASSAPVAAEPTDAADDSILESTGSDLSALAQ
ncbi:MAG TPA: choice-of-anchor Q domain-containing protein [Tepidisphaeraceae bacterium]|nr:choice-of-anchor Q domain-containing protein [Tepidisphaeraceae bacterium]